MAAFKWRWSLLTPALALLLILADLFFGSLDRVEFAIDDVLLRGKAATHAADDSVVLIDIDQKSLENMNETAGSFPWPRAIHAELIDHIAAQHPRAIVFDLFFNEADTFRADSDALFRNAVMGQSNVYLPTLLLADGHGMALKQLAQLAPGLKLTGRDEHMAPPLLLPLIIPPEHWRGGTVNFTADTDGVGRHYVKEELRGDWRIPSLPLRLAQDFGWTQPPQPRFLINWFKSGVPHFSYSDIYEDMNKRHPQRPADEFRNKIVLIGATAPGLADLRVTPLGNTYQAAQLLATAIQNLEHGDWLKEWHLRFWLSFFLLLALCLAFRRVKSLWRIGAALALISIAIIAAAVLILWQANTLVYGVSALASAWVLFAAQGGIAYIRERQERQRTQALFGRFLDPRVVSKLVSDGDLQVSTSVQAREVTILFSDIRGFTTLSETRHPEEIVDLLNRYFSRQVEVIFRHGGTLDKFIGDAIMAFWGAPVDDPQHAKNAVAAALEMVEVLLEFRRDLGELSTVFDVGIGIHTGPAVVGFIGAKERLDYTAIGDAVNLASRIEGQTKGVARILVSENTRVACGGHFEFIEHGSVHVKGRQAAVQLFEPKVKGC